MNKLKATTVFERTFNSKKKIVFNRGSARSSKTRSIIQTILLKLITEKRKRIIVVRKTLAILKDTFIHELQEEIENLGIGGMLTYWKQQAKLYCFVTGSTIKFLGADEPQKFRGLEANYWVFNEANEIPYEFFKQAMIRMSRASDDGKPNQFYIDFNPSSRFSWVKTKVEDVREDVDVITSTYKDNPFLADEAIKEIERLKDLDPDAWKIYGLGEYTDVKGAIYKNFNLVDSFPVNAKKVGYGLDFGYSVDPTALVRVGELHGELYVEEVFYEKELLTDHIIKRFSKYGLRDTDTIIADSDEVRLIKEIALAGWRCLPCKKGPDSVRYGISTVKNFKLNIVKKSHNLLTELNLYKWKEDRNGNPTQVPIDNHNHLLDALRYYVNYMYKSKQKGKIFIY